MALVEIEHATVTGSAWVTERAYATFWGPVEGWTLVVGGSTQNYLPAPMRYRGSYSASARYVSGDVAEHGGLAFVALQPVTAVTPGTDATKWKLVASGGAGGVTSVNGLTGAVEIAPSWFPAERVSDHGAIGDGTSHPVSEFYSTLSAAQAAFPTIPDIALTDEIDWAATQKAFDTAAARGTGTLRAGSVIFDVPHLLFNRRVLVHQQAIKASGRGRGINGTAIQWTGPAGSSWGGAANDNPYTLFNVKDSSGCEWTDMTFLGKNSAKPAALIYFQEVTPFTTMGENEYLAIRRCSFGRRWTKNLTAAGQAVRGIWIGGSDTNQDAWTIEDSAIYEMETGLDVPNTQSIWGNLRNVHFDTNTVGMNLSSSVMIWNLTCNRNGKDFNVLRDTRVHIFGYWSEHAAQLFTTTQGASLYINGGRALLHGEMLGQPYWGDVQALNGDPVAGALGPVLNIQNFVTKSLSASTANARLRIEGSTTASIPGTVIMRGNKLNRGDESAGYLINGYVVGAAGGIYVDIEQATYRFKAYVTTTVATARVDLTATTLTVAGSDLVPVVAIVPRIQPLAMRPTGVTAETLPSRQSTLANLAVLVPGRLHFALIHLLAGDVVTNLTFASATTAAGTPANQWFCLYSLAMAKLAVTSDDTTTAWPANTRKTLALSAPYTVTTSGLYYVGILYAGTTAPTLAGVASASTQASSLPPISSGFSTAALTTPASAPEAAAALTASAALPWAYAS